MTQVAEFNGTTSKIAVADHSSIARHFHGKAFPIAGYMFVEFYPRTIGETTGRLFNKRNSAGTAGYTIFLTAGSASHAKVDVIYDWSGTDMRTVNATAVVRYNAWNRLCFVYRDDASANNMSWCLWNQIDGGALYDTSLGNLTESTSPTGTASDDTGQPVTIGNLADQSRTFDGFMHDLVLFDGPVTQAEMLSLVSEGVWQPGITIKARWLLEGNANDSSGNGNTGTPTDISWTDRTDLPSFGGWRRRKTMSGGVQELVGGVSG